MIAIKLKSQQLNWPETRAEMERSRDVAIATTTTTAANDFDGNEKIIYPHVSTSACATPRNERGREGAVAKNRIRSWRLMLMLVICPSISRGHVMM